MVSPKGRPPRPAAPPAPESTAVGASTPLDLAPGVRRYALLAILFVALVVRLWGIGSDLPETFEVATPMTAAQGFWAGPEGKLDLNPHTSGWPALSFYITFAEQAAVRAAGSVLGRYRDRNAFLEAISTERTPFFLVARIGSTLFAVASVLLLYLLAARLFSPAAGLGAALLLALNPLHVVNSRQVTDPNVLITFFSLLALLSLHSLLEKGRWRDYLLAGLWIGLGTAAKYLPVLLVIPFVLAHVVRARGERRPAWRLLLDPRLGAGLVAVVAGFFAGSPFSILDFDTFLRDFQFQKGQITIGHFGTEALRHGWGYYLTTGFPRSLTWPVAVVSAAGILFLLVGRRPRVWLPLLFLLVHFLAVGAWKTVFDHYMLPVVPVLLAGAAAVLVALVSRAPLPGGRLLPAALALFGLLLVAPALDLYAAATQRGREDTRVTARRWIEANVPPRSLIAQELYTGELPADRYSTVQIQLNIVTPNVYDYQYYPDWYEDFDYVVVSSGVYGRYRSRCHLYRIQCHFYDHLDQSWDLVKDIRAEGGPGPTIRIYRRRNPPSGLAEDVLEQIRGEREGRANVSLFLAALGFAHQKKSDLARAVTYYQASIAVNDQFAGPHHSLGTVYLARNEVEKAIESFRRALAVDPDYGPAHYNLGRALASAGRPEEAMVEFERYLRIMPDGPNADVIRRSLAEARAGGTRGKGAPKPGAPGGAGPRGGR